MSKSRYYKKEVIEETKKRSNSICECCGTDIKLDKHHILEFSNGGLSTSENLIALCPTCHRQIPQFLSKEQQQYLQKWHNENRSITHNITLQKNEYYIGNNKYINCKHPLVINSQSIFTPYEINGKFYVNIVMLEDFEPQMLVLSNRVILNSNCEVITSNEKLLVKVNGIEVYKLFKKSNFLYLHMNFKYKGLLFIFNECQAQFPGVIFSGCSFNMPEAIVYKYN